MDKKFLIVLGVFAIAVVVLIIVLKFPQKKTDSKMLRINQNQYEVEVVSSLISQARGLSGRESIAGNEGMLFVFTESKVQTFWMQGMRFPIDIVWINNGKVIGMTTDVPYVPQTKQYSSPSPANMVLELKAGTVIRDQIMVGDEIKIAN
jgi:hypothetical protein